MIFTRLMMAFLSFCGGLMISYRLPSMRYRTRKLFSYGSM